MALDLKYIPMTAFFSLFTTLVISFTLGYYYKHITTKVPYISDSGAYPPESCIFGQVLNMCSVLMFLCMYIRYRQIDYLIGRHDLNYHIMLLNRRAFFLGAIAAFGVSIVANFQEVLLLMHWIGATLAFGLGAIYQCLQTSIYFKLYPMIGTKNLNRLRLAISIASVLFFTAFFTTGVVSNQQFRGTDGPKWQPEDGGYDLHVISAITEWLVAGCTMIYLFLLKLDFETVTIKEPEIFVQDSYIVALKNKSEVESVDSFDSGRY